MYVHPVTLEPPCAQAGDVVGVRAFRQPLRKEKITVRILPQVTKLVLLCMHAKTVLATYKRHREFIANLMPHKFLWDSLEEDRVERHITRRFGRTYRLTCLSSAE